MELQQAIDLVDELKATFEVTDWMEADDGSVITSREIVGWVKALDRVLQELGTYDVRSDRHQPAQCPECRTSTLHRIDCSRRGMLLVR